MKNLNELDCVINLTASEEVQIEGGTFWGDVAYVIGAIIGAGVTMGEGAQGNPHI